MKLFELIEGLEYEVLQGDITIEINNIQNDSRNVEPGDLFFCIKAEKSP